MDILKGILKRQDILSFQSCYVGSQLQTHFDFHAYSSSTETLSLFTDL